MFHKLRIIEPCQSVMAGRNGEIVMNASDYLSQNRTWFMALGIALIVLGVIAIIFPFFATLAVKIMLGWLFLISGLVQTFSAFSTPKWSGFFWSLLVGLLYVVAGAWLAFLPLSGIITLTILLAVMFFAQGIFELIMGFGMRPLQGWGWAVASGIIALVVGAMIMAQLPSSAIWAIGMLAGINMISSGWTYFLIAQAVPKS